MDYIVYTHTHTLFVVHYFIVKDNKGIIDEKQKIFYFKHHNSLIYEGVKLKF